MITQLKMDVGYAKDGTIEVNSSSLKVSPGSGLHLASTKAAFLALVPARPAIGILSRHSKRFGGSRCRSLEG